MDDESGEPTEPMEEVSFFLWRRISEVTERRDSKDRVSQNWRD